MQKELMEKKQWFHSLNKYSDMNNILFVGSTFIHDFPINELEINFQMEYTVYNRGIKGLELKELKQLLDVCVFELEPSKIFLSIGEEDIKSTDFSIDNFIGDYLDVIDKIKTKLPKSSLYVMGILPTNDKYITVNNLLQKKLQTIGVEYIDFGYKFLDENKTLNPIYVTEKHEFLPNAYVVVLSDLKRFFRNRMMGFGDIWNMVEKWY